MSVLYLNVCRLCVPNIMGLGIFLKNGTLSNLTCLLDTASRFALFSVSCLKDEKLIKSKPTWTNIDSMMDTVEYFCQMSSKFILTISSYTIAKFMHFSETQCMLFYCCRNKTNASRTHSNNSNSSTYTTVCKNAHPHWNDSAVQYNQQ